MKTVIYFIRHGEVDNPQNILYGRLPRFPITLKGRKKISKNAVLFKRLDIERIYSSPMLRARQTAQIIAETLSLKVKITKLTNEVKLIFAGMTLPEYKTNIQPFLYTDKYIRMGQESIETIYSRMFKFIKIVIKRHTGKKILAVSHGDPILILKAGLTNTEFTWEYKKENYLKTGEYLVLTYDDGQFIWM